MTSKSKISNTTPEEWDAIRTEQLQMYHSLKPKDPMMKIYNTRPKDKQVGGSHYKDMAIQPLDYCVANKLDPYQTNIIKYASRMYNKNQCISDLDKIIHYAELAKENALTKGIQ